MIGDFGGKTGIGRHDEMKGKDFNFENQEFQEFLFKSMDKVDEKLMTARELGKGIEELGFEQDKVYMCNDLINVTQNAEETNALRNNFIFIKVIPPNTKLSDMYIKFLEYGSIRSLRYQQTH